MCFGCFPGVSLISGVVGGGREKSGPTLWLGLSGKASGRIVRRSLARLGQHKGGVQGNDGMMMMIIRRRMRWRMRGEQVKKDDGSNVSDVGE